MCIYSLVTLILGIQGRKNRNIDTLEFPEGLNCVYIYILLRTVPFCLLVEVKFDLQSANPTSICFVLFVNSAELTVEVCNCGLQ